MCLQVYGITTLPLFPFLAVTCSRDTTIRWLLGLTLLLSRASGVLPCNRRWLSALLALSAAHFCKQCRAIVP